MRISSKKLSATVNNVGAELQSLIFNGKELLWQGKERFWPLTAPILFPFCGFLKNSFYLHEGNKHEAPVHGFASHSEFKIESRTDSKITYVLSENEQTKKPYPFDFKLSISYELCESKLKIDFKVENTSKKVILPYSIGWHPGFIIADNSYIKFSQSEFKKRQVSKDGLIGEAETLKCKNGILKLNQDTFKHGGIVIEDHNSEVTLHTPDYEINFDLEEFPNLVLWGQPGADFVCIEPWYGMGDSVNHNNTFIDKEYLLTLNPGESKSLKTSLKIKA